MLSSKRQTYTGTRTHATPQARKGLKPLRTHDFTGVSQTTLHGRHHRRNPMKQQSHCTKPNPQRRVAHTTQHGPRPDDTGHARRHGNPHAPRNPRRRTRGRPHSTKEPTRHATRKLISVTQDARTDRETPTRKAGRRLREQPPSGLIIHRSFSYGIWGRAHSVLVGSAADSTVATAFLRAM